MLSIGNKKYRNLQEQVGYNTECIQELAEAIDGITLEDKLVIIANDSGTFTEKDMTVLNGPLAFISDGSKVWLKQSETASEFVFKAIDIVATEVGGTHYNVGGSKIVVTRATRAYATSDDVIITTYDKTQMDALLSGKADLSGANFTGAITGPSIIEDMIGYSFTPSLNTAVHYNYVGVCKNGNKITFAVAGYIESDSGINAYTTISLGQFNIPSAVGQKLFANGLSYLDIKKQLVFSSLYATKDLIFLFQKNTNINVEPQITTASVSLDANTKYYFRDEVTFLLSDNLAS